MSGPVDVEPAPTTSTVTAPDVSVLQSTPSNLGLPAASSYPGLPGASVKYLRPWVEEDLKKANCRDDPDTLLKYFLWLASKGSDSLDPSSEKTLVDRCLNAVLPIPGLTLHYEAHEKAFELLKLLHRDIGFGNIILTDDGNGWSTNWEFAKDVDEIGNSRPERTGTRRFTSANLLRDANEHHSVTDDLESFLHMLAWAIIRYASTTPKYTFSARVEFLNSIFDKFRIEGGRGISGWEKGNLLAGRGYPPGDFVLLDPSPLLTLLEKLSEPFQSRYTRRPPTARERLDYEKFRTTPADKPMDLATYSTDTT